MDILIIGSGYVGLVTGTSFAEMGHKVICLDIDRDKIEKLKNKIIPIYEPGLKELVDRNVKAKRLFFTTNYEQGVKSSKVIFFAVPTPSKEDGSCNTSYIEAAAKEVSKHLNDYKVLVNKSTSPMGTSFTIEKIVKEELEKKNLKIDFDIVSNPEFLKEGTALLDCMKPDRIVIGAKSEKAFKIMHDIYSSFMMDKNKIIEMDILSAELTKYAANAMLATRISFMNELSKICKLYGADINSIRKGIGSDKRIGMSFLYAGIGFGGSCFPKDLKAICFLSKEKGHTPLLLEAVKTINDEQKRELANNIRKYFEKKGGIKGKTIAIWGVAFKPDTDDVRDAPSLTLIEELQSEGANLRLYDPIALENIKKFLKNLKNITLCKDEFDSVKGADGIALLTEWKQFRRVKFEMIKEKMQTKVFFDGRNQYTPCDMRKKGFDYIGIGVPDLVEN
jgi:UDPglucose 6-dehydrogenase